MPLIGDQLDALLPRFITDGMGVTFYFGGTSLLIIVGVSMDTVQQVESQLIMRHYDGFMKQDPHQGVVVGSGWESERWPSPKGPRSTSS